VYTAHRAASENEVRNLHLMWVKGDLREVNELSSSTICNLECTHPSEVLGAEELRSLEDELAQVATSSRAPGVTKEKSSIL
jgi:hypothetical protein